MARQVRIEYPGAIYHVMARGDRREPIVRDERDRECFRHTLAGMCVRTGARLHAWALLENHYHLVLETPEGNLVAAMRWFQNTYARRFNVRHGLWGHLFGGRYKALLVDPKAAYFGRVVDYVHLNPPRAGVCDLSAGGEWYPWSSLAEYCARPDRRHEWLATERAFMVFGLEDDARGRRQFAERLVARFRADVEAVAASSEGGEDCGISVRAIVPSGWYIGGETFKKTLLVKLSALTAGGKGPRRSDGYNGSQASDHAEDRARALLVTGCEILRCDLEKLRSARANLPSKKLLAELIAAETSQPLDWIRAELGMKSRSHCSRLINDQRRWLAEHPEAREERARILERAKSTD